MKIRIFLLIIIFLLIMGYLNHGILLKEKVKSDLDSENIKYITLNFTGLRINYVLENREDIENFISIIKNIKVRKNIIFEIEKETNYADNLISFQAFIKYNYNLENKSSVKFIGLYDTKNIQLGGQHYIIVSNYNFDDVEKIIKNITPTKQIY